MELPEQTQQLITECLEKVHSDPQHYLTPGDRTAIYQSFSSTPKFYGWLAVIAAEKVIPVWENRQRDAPFPWNEDADELPKLMLQAAKAILLGKTPTELHPKLLTYDKTISAELELALLFWEEIMGLESNTTWPVYSSVNAAYDTFSYINQPKAIVQLDNIVENALIAYAGIDKNPPGLWHKTSLFEESGFQAYLIPVDPKELSQKLQDLLKGLFEKEDETVFTYRMMRDFVNKTVKQLEQFVPFDADLQKAQEFWEWWLTEALPEAWQRANEIL